MDERTREFAIRAITALADLAEHAPHCPRRRRTRDQSCQCSYQAAAQFALEALVALQTGQSRGAVTILHRGRAVRIELPEEVHGPS